MRNRFLALALTTATLAGTANAATGIDFDCDVPADSYSTVAADSVGPAYAVAGTVILVRPRSGNYVPTAGVRFAAIDGGGVGLQLISQGARWKMFDVVLNLREGDKVTRQTFGSVDLSRSLAFRLSVAEQGKVTLSIADRVFEVAGKPLSAVKTAAFCSTGQFKFSGLVL
jgi:hypothetical protein